MRRLISLALISLLLSGCAYFRQPSVGRAAPAINKTLSSTARHDQLYSLRNWQVSGAISIRFQGKTEIGSFSWTQRGRRFDFRTFGPLHMAGIRIEGRPGQVRLWKNASESITDRSPEALMRRQLGWSLPLTNLQYWGRGIMAPGISASKRTDKYGHLTLLNQQGWRIHYHKYQGVKGMDLPRTMKLDRRDVHVKIVFKQWRLS